jgi:hypothetical protein
MWFHSLLASWKSGHSRSPRPRPARRATRLVLEHLEDRSLPSSYTAGSVHDLIADINAANAAGGSNTIQLTAATTKPYSLTKVENTTNGATGLPVIAANDNLTILGNGDTIERTTKSGTPDFRLLAVATGGWLTLGNLTLQGGVAYGGGVQAEGGAIYNQGTLVLHGVTVQGNMAVGAQEGDYAFNGVGGGIFSGGGSVTLEGGTLVQNNEALGGSPVQGNAGDGIGGGLCALGGTVIVTSATLDNNAAIGGEGYTGGLYGSIGYNGYGYGGGLYASDATVTVSNATLVGNVATYATNVWPLLHGGSGGGADGGGLYLYYGTATLTNCTVQANSAKSSASFGGGLGYGGGGLFIYGGTTVYLDSFTVAHTINNTPDDIEGVYILL